MYRLLFYSTCSITEVLMPMLLFSLFLGKNLRRCLKSSWFLLMMGIFFFGQTAAAQTSEPAAGKQEDLFSVGVGAQYGFIFAHSEDVQNTSGARPFGVELILSWQSNDEATWNLCNCFPRKGLLLNYYNFDVALLGKGATVAYFLEPTYRITDRASFSFKGSAGLSYLTNPFDSVSNPTNQSYSTAINAYLLFGVGAWFRVSERWWINPSVNYQHISNGGTKKPNKGINWPTAGVAISYQPQFRPYYTGARTTEKFWKNYTPRWDIGLIGAYRRGYDAEGQRIRSPLVGVFAQSAKQVGRISALTLGAEIYRDNELRNLLSKESIDASPVKAGVMAGHEFILGKFLFSQRLGYYVLDETPYFDQIFHRWGLLYRVNRHLGAGFSLLAHRQVAEFIDFRVTYSFQKRYE